MPAEALAAGAVPVVPAAVFVERESLELKQFQAFLESESPSCEVVLACDVTQAAVLACRRRGRARVVVIHGGLADGRAQEFLARLRARQENVEHVAFVDRRHFRGTLAEASVEQLQADLKSALADGWLFVRFLDPRR